ncbi:MAG: extracellular solute-binding protein [Ruminococcus sp.]|nr:extracellular solute-binding protein [Ruminococcus sp.]
MRKMHKAAAGLMAFMMVFSAASCGGAKDKKKDSASEKKLEESQQEVVDRLAAEADKRELESSTIRWFSHWDINPTSSEDKDIGVDLALFKTMYDGKIDYISTTWDTKFDDLAKRVMADDSPDFIGADDMDVFPKCAMKSMIQPIDDYIDFDSPLWADMKPACDQFVYQGQHYVGVSRVDPCYIFIYNKKTIEDAGFDDPADLFAKGEWNWDTMSKMCIDFTDPEKEKYALDGWYYENALTQSTGKPLVGMENGNIVNNITSPELAKAQNMMYDLQKNNVVYPKHLHEWKVRGDAFGVGIGSGETLFYPIGLWAIEDSLSSTAAYGDISAGEVMFVPVPCAKDSDAQYVPSRIHGFCICKGAKNPEGVAAWLDCTRYAEADEAAHRITMEQLQADYGWTDEMMEMRETIYDLAEAHPVFEFSQGISADLSSLADNITKATMHPAEPTTWTAVVEENQRALDYLINEAQENISQ